MCVNVYAYACLCVFLYYTLGVCEAAISKEITISLFYYNQEKWSEQFSKCQVAVLHRL